MFEADVAEPPSEEPLNFRLRQNTQDARSMPPMVPLVGDEDTSVCKPFIWPLCEPSE